MCVRRRQWFITQGAWSALRRRFIVRLRPSWSRHRRSIITRGDTIIITVIIAGGIMAIVTAANALAA